MFTSGKDLPSMMTVSMGLVVFEENKTDVFVRCSSSLEKMLTRAARDADGNAELVEYDRAIELTDAGVALDQAEASESAVKWALLREIYAGNRGVAAWARRLVVQDRSLAVKLACIDAITDFGDESDLQLLESPESTSADPTVEQACKFAMHKLQLRLSGATSH